MVYVVMEISQQQSSVDMVFKEQEAAEQHVIKMLKSGGVFEYKIVESVLY